MRIVSYHANGDDVWRTGIVVDGRVIDAQGERGIETSSSIVSSRSILENGHGYQKMLAAVATERAAQGDGHSFEDLLAERRLGPPVHDPEKIICVGLNYADHAAEAEMEAPPVPTLFAKFRNSLTGPGQPVALPPASREVDYEGELAAVIGTRCKSVSVAGALAAVGGYMPANDVSARDLQMQTPQWLAGKAVDGFAPCGPALVTADEVPDPQALRLTTRVDGQVVQDASTADMIFSVAEIVSFVSSFLTLEPGDIILTGTPSGVGFKRDPQILLQAGNVVDVEIETLGTLRNEFVGAVWTVEPRIDGVEVAHRKLRGAILSGDLPAGAEFSQVALGRQLEIGRTPLREAVRMLQREGLIETERHRRIRIAPFSLADLEHLYAMRIVFESFALQQTVSRLDDGELRELQRLLEEMDACADARDVTGWEVPHRAFHGLLVRHAGARLVRAVEELGEHSERYRRVYVAQGPRAWSVGAGEHAEIVAACLERDAAAAGERLALHLSKTALTVVMLVAPEHDPTVVRAAIQSSVTRR